MTLSKEKLVQLVQCAGLDLVKNADKLVDDIDGRTRFKIDILIMMDGQTLSSPLINVHQEHISKVATPVVTDVMDFDEILDSYILDRVEAGETYKVRMEDLNGEGSIL